MKINNLYKTIKPVFPYILLLFLATIQAYYFLNTRFKDESANLFARPLYLFSTFCFYVLLAQINQKLLKIFLVFAFFVAVFFFPILTIYGEVDNSFAAAVFYTHSEESLSYLKIIPFKVFVLLGILLVFTLYLLQLDFEKGNKKVIIPIMSVLLLIQPAKKLLTNSLNVENIDAYVDVLPIKKLANFSKELYYIKSQHDFIVETTSKPHSWKVEKTDSTKQPKVFVVVVGESVRRDFMHTYGFPVENTPFISSSPHLQFDNYWGVSLSTIPSLVRTLALTNDFPKYELHTNLMNLAQSAGFETYWISNQGQVGIFDTPITAIAKSSKYFHFLKQGNSFARQFTDFDLLPEFNKVLKENPEIPNKLIVLHNMGSHPPSCNNTGEKYDEFFLSQDVSCYVQSIKNTDRLLQNIHQSLENLGVSYKMIYFSDHGLKINEDLVMTHGKSMKQCYEIPLLIWGNDITTTKHFTAQRSAKDFLHLFTELNGIETANLKKKYLFVSEESAGKNQFILGPDEKPINYEDLPDNSIQLFLK